LNAPNPAGITSAARRERLRAWLILGRVPGIGPQVADRLVEHFGEPIRVLTAGRAELQAIGLQPTLVDAILAPPEAVADADLAWAEGEGVRILTRDDPDYPSRLAQVGVAPILLFVRGEPHRPRGPHARHRGQP